MPHCLPTLLAALKIFRQTTCRACTTCPWRQLGLSCVDSYRTENQLGRLRARLEANCAPVMHNYFHEGKPPIHQPRFFPSPSREAKSAV